MKKYLLLFIMIMCCFSVFASGWRQCRNCGKHFKPNGGDEYCARNVCQKARRKEAAAIKRGTMSLFLHGMAKEQKAKEQLAECSNILKNTKSSEKQLQAIKKFCNFPRTSSVNYDFPPVILAYANIDVIKKGWPTPKTDEEINRAKKFLSSNWSSWEFASTPFALGKNKQTQETRYTEEIRRVFNVIVDNQRYDVMSYILEQMGGANFNDLLTLIKDKKVLHDIPTDAEYQKAVGKLIQEIEKERKTAADDHEERQLQSEIAKRKKKTDDLLTKEFPALRKRNAKFIDVIFKHTSDEEIKKFLSFLDELQEKEKFENDSVEWLTTFNYSNVKDDYRYLQRVFKDKLLCVKIWRNTKAISEWVAMSSDKRLEKYKETYSQIKRFTWKAGKPNVKRIGIMSGTKEGTWTAAPGFTIQKDGTAKWTPGLSHPVYPSTVAAEKIFTWVPNKSSIWFEENSKNDLHSGDPGIGLFVYNVLKERRR